MELTNKEIAIKKIKNTIISTSTPNLIYSETIVGSIVYTVITKHIDNKQTSDEYYVYDRNKEFYPLVIRKIMKAIEIDKTTYDSKGSFILPLELEQGTFYVHFYFQEESTESIVIIKVVAKNE